MECNDIRTSMEEKIYRSFNVLGIPFQIDEKDLRRYPKTLLADRFRLQPYWRSRLNVYFLSRDVQMFERIILPFYTLSKPINKISRSSMISLSEKEFREELAFYDLLRYYEFDDISHWIVEHRPTSSSLMFLLFRLVLEKLVSRCVFDLLSCLSCAIGMIELIRRRCYSRSETFLLGDVLMSCCLLLTLFFEQYSDRLWLRIKSILLINTEKDEHQPILLLFCQSLTSIVELLLTTFSFLLTLISYKSSGLSFRHFLLLRFCLPEMFHLLDLFSFSGRSICRFISEFLLFFLSIVFLCLWLGLTIYVSDSNVNSTLAPSGDVYFVYHLILNVGYGDRSEQSTLSFLLIVLITLIGCPLLIIRFQNVLEELNLMKNKTFHIGTFSHRSTLNDLIFFSRRSRRNSKLI